jgi:oligopeptide/dipeptide ABC transporter ATP-binding protein
LRLLEVEGLKLRFDTPEGVVGAINDVSFDLSEGEVLGLVGESGCGKTATALTLMRLVPMPPGRIESGSVRLRGVDLLGLSEAEMRKVRAKTIAMVFQDPMAALNPVITIGHQITEPLRVHRSMSKDQAIRRALELMRMVGIPDPERRLGEYPHQLSGGMRQRAMIAMALSCEPEILIADEPTTALDVTIQAEILDLLDDLRHRLGLAMILITHNLGVVAALADRINVMYAGRIVEEGLVTDVLGSPGHPYTEALLAAVPRLDGPGELVPIEGTPPDLVNLPPGCAFYQRCRYRRDPRCEGENPPLRDAGPGRRVASFYDLGARAT